jgi:predicted O-methyltransferase YrrM
MRETPWLTPGALWFLEQLLKLQPRLRVLEFGCGGSTFWLAKQGANLVSIEHDKHWQTVVQERLDCEGLKAELRLLPRPYDGVCAQFPDQCLDLVLVDGRDRIRCVRAAMPKLRPGGVLMLDNAERPRYNEARALLSGWEYNRATQQGRWCSSAGYSSSTFWATDWWVKPAKVSPTTT